MVRDSHNPAQEPADRVSGEVLRGIGRHGGDNADPFASGAWREQAPAAPLGAVLTHPTLGRILFSPSHLPSRALRSYYDRATPAIGGGEYPRMLTQPATARIYRVRKLCAEGEFSTITQALAQWNADRPGAGPARAGVIEIADSATYHEAPSIELLDGEDLQLRAASMMRPVLRMFDYHSGAPEQVAVQGAPGSRFTLDGLLVAGGGFEVHGGTLEGWPRGVSTSALCHVTLRHCTLVPGWDTESGREAPWSGKASVTLATSNIVVRVDHSILGPVRMPAEATGGIQIALHISDSVVDAGHAAGLVISDERWGAAMAKASFVRSTIIGLAQLQEIALAENTLFLGPLLVARRDKGCVRYCYLAPGSRTPEQLDCQPDRKLNAPGSSFQPEELRVRPRFRSLRYGTPDYCQLGPDCAVEITAGADDDTQMGVFHDMHQMPLGAAFEVDGRPCGEIVVA